MASGIKAGKVTNGSGVVGSVGGKNTPMRAGKEARRSTGAAVQSVGGQGGANRSGKEAKNTSSVQTGKGCC